jgi:ubiquinone/menaquinone biosynthesis C-methylase UbiE
MEEIVRRAIKPTAAEIAALPPDNNEAVAARLLAGRGGAALDIGCGPGTFTRSLTALFPAVSGIDINPKSIAKAQAAAADAGRAIDFRVVSGDALPYADGSFDTAIFSNSIHHMPDIAAALDEARRVLRPGGLLYVMEPVPAGGFHEGTKLVSDETVVRADAYRALLDLAARAMEPQIEIMYRGSRRFQDFAQWHDDQIERSPARQAAFDAQPEAVRRCFEAHAQREAGGYGFETVSRVNLLRKPG